MRTRGYGREKCQFRSRLIETKAVDSAVARVGDDHQVAGFIEREVHGIDGAVADCFKMARRGPAKNVLPVRVDEIELAVLIDSGARDIEEATSQLFDFCAGGDYRGRFFWGGRSVFARDRQRTDFALADLNVMGLVVDSIVE